MSYKVILTICFLFLFTCNSIAQTKVLTLRNDLENKSNEKCWINQSTLHKGKAFSGICFSSTDSANLYSFGYRGPFPELCRNKNLKISVQARVRSEREVENIFLVFSLSYKDSVVFWKSFDVSESIKGHSEWTEVSDEFNVPESMTDSAVSLSAYLWNKDGKTKVDLDDLQLDFLEMKFPSFLPEVLPEIENKSGWMKITSSMDYALFYNKEDGNLKLLNAKGDTLIRSVGFYTEWISDKKEKKVFWARRLNLKSDSLTEEGMFYRFTAQNEMTDNSLLLLAGNDGKISLTLTTVFLKPASLFRQAFCLGYGLPLKEVERKNGRTDMHTLKGEYWLNKEGFILANKNTSFILYRPENISSVQLDVKNRIAVLNMDYAKDHPFLHYPLMNENNNVYEDYSSSPYEKNDTLKSSVTFYSSVASIKLPRLLSNPNGFLASWIWTDHADYGDLRTNKAVYFGSEKIDSSSEATGGFVKYTIPVTKSIFYANPDKVDNAEKSALFPGQEVCYKESEDFRKFLLQLQNRGFEICLHTPDHFTTRRNILLESLDAMHKVFNPVTWIDHGYDNSSKSNREDLVCDGYDRKSEWYSADLWKMYGLKYFWNSYYEDTGVYSDYSFNSFYSVPYAGWGDAFPTPYYWRNRRTNDIIHWGTMNTIDLPDGSLWQYLFNDERLMDVVKNRTDVIVHCYTSRVDSSNGYYVIDSNEVSINANFNNALKKLAEYGSNSRIWITTIGAMLDYRLSLESISMDVLKDGTVIINNKGKNTIVGLTFAACATDAAVMGKSVKSKIVDDELIFWFDLPGGESVRVTLK